MIPCVYCLTTKKDEQFYTKIFGHVISLARKLDLNLQQRRLTIDFEIATMNSFCRLFPTASVTGCLFHYAQRLWRKIQELGLSRHVSYSIDEENIDISSDEKKRADHWFLAPIGLALIPPELVESTWAEVMDEYTPEHVTAIKFNDYLVSTYVDSSSVRYHSEIQECSRVVGQQTFHARIITLKVLIATQISVSVHPVSSTLSKVMSRGANTSITSLKILLLFSKSVRTG